MAKDISENLEKAFHIKSSRLKKNYFGRKHGKTSCSERLTFFS
jgi:hypothetical protein